MGQFLGERVKEMREARGLSQREVAEAIGVSKTLITLWESNKREPNLRDLFLLADTLKTSASFFLDGDDRDDEEAREFFELGKALPDELRPLGKQILKTLFRYGCDSEAATELHFRLADDRELVAV